MLPRMLPSFDDDLPEHPCEPGTLPETSCEPNSDFIIVEPQSEASVQPSSDNEDHSSPAPSSIRKKRKCSQYWEHFEAPVDGKVKCKHCPTKIAVKDDNSTGTSSLKRHQQRHGFYVPKDPSQPMLMPMGLFNKDQALERLCDFIVGDQQAFFLVEHPAFQAFVSALQPSFKLPGADAIRDRLLKEADGRRGKLRDYLARLDSNIAITTDAWTAPNADQYLTVTGHWIDNAFRQQCLLLGFVIFPSPHTAAAAEELVFGVIKSWEIENKVIACVTDNTASAFNISKLLAQRLASQPLFEMRCRTHVLQLVVKDALKDEGIQALILKARKLSVRVRKSAPLQAALEAACLRWSVKYTRPLRDMEVRWSSSFSMIDALLPMRSAITYFQQLPEHAQEFADSLLLSGTWMVLQEVRDMLEPFKFATDCLQGQYTTLSMLVRMYDVLMRKVKALEDSNASGVGRRIAAGLDEGLEARKGLLIECQVTQWAAILDPSLKMGLIGLHPRPQQVTAGLSTFVDKHYKASTSEQAAAPSTSKSGWAAMVREQVGHIATSVRTPSLQLNEYLAEPRSGETLDTVEEILAYWQSAARRNPQLAALARDILAIPATTVASESAFSRSKLLISDRRTRLKGSTVSTLMLLDKWYHQYPKIFTSA